VFEGDAGEAKPSVAYCSNDERAKKVAAQLISDAGFEPIDAGSLRIARYTEPFALLMGQLAYEGDRGPAVAYRFEWFKERK
jgi:8-hydroxy-5-deazaflavin:NADPH oxidoreductase